MEAVLNAPTHRWEIETQLDGINKELLSGRSIVRDDRQRTSDAHQKLLAREMGVFAAYVPARHVEDKEIPLGNEGDRAREFSS